MNKQQDAITVITLTRKRDQLLQRAITSVKHQYYEGLIIHLIIIDDCLQTRTLLEKLDLPDTIIWHFVPRSPGEKPGPKRLATLRNYGVQLSKTKWIAFLDDDNEFEAEHLSSLIDLATRTASPAVHSYRKLYNRDGSPYLEQRMPWARDEEVGRQMYSNGIKQGIVRPGSNIMRDKFRPMEHCINDVFDVDTGELLLTRDLLMQNPFREDEYSLQDWYDNNAEDPKLLEQLRQNNVFLFCTEKPTLKYYLGGFSNASNKSLTPGIWIAD